MNTPADEFRQSNSEKQVASQAIQPDRPKINPEIHHMEAELRLTLEEIARLQNALAEANMKNVALQASLDSQTPEPESNHLIKPFVQELKQPLHTIQGYLDLLLNESVGILGTFQKRFVERIATSVSHMEKTLKNIEIDAGENEEEDQQFTTNFSLTLLIEETLALYTDLIRTKSITLKVNFEKNEINIMGDEEKIERILNILLTNALSAVAEEGVITLGLKILQGKKPAQILVSVQSNDNESVKSKPLPVIIEEFKDLDTKLEGFGSPLSDLVKAGDLVEEMHGMLEIFSLPSNGSLTRIRLPASSQILTK